VDWRALKDHGSGKGDAGGDGNPNGGVDGSPQAGKDGKREEPEVEVENGQFGKHEHKGVVDLDRVNKLDPVSLGESTKTLS